jgi:type IV fimbrial biogenesis protein FimT
MRHFGDMTTESGFSLVELILVIAILAILAAVAVPAFSVWLPNYELRSAARDIFSDFQQAKLRAVKENANCTICFNQVVDFVTYDYLVFIDADNDLEFDVGEEIVNRKRWTNYDTDGDAINDNVMFDSTQGGGDGLAFADNDDGLPALSFRSNGLPIQNDGSAGSGTIFLRNRKNRTTNVTISTTGNIQIN